MLVDLTVRGRNALVVGEGDKARARRDALAREGARVTLAQVTSERRGKRTRRGRAGPVATAPDPIGLMRKVRPVLVFSTLENVEANRKIANAAHSLGALVHVYDAPALSDFTLPSTGEAGPIHLAVSTSGRSPAMAALLRRRLERAIRPRDVAMVRLQGRLRPTIQRTIPTHEGRRDVIYRLLRHRELARLLRANRFDEALTVAQKVVASSVSRSAPVARKGRR